MVVDANEAEANDADLVNKAGNGKFDCFCVDDSFAIILFLLTLIITVVVHYN